MPPNPCTWNWTQETWASFCARRPDCSACTSSRPVASAKPGGIKVTIDGASTGTGGAQMPVPAEQLRLDNDGEWTILTPEEVGQIEHNLTKFETTLPEDPLSRNMALSGFYGTHGLELKRIEALGSALIATTEHPNPQIAVELSGALEKAGFAEAALQTWAALPTMIDRTDPDARWLLSNAMRNRGRILDGLDQPIEANIALATAELVDNLAGVALP